MAKTKYPILYVDDEPDNLTVFKSTFRRDYKVHMANSGEEALEVLTTNEIFVIITDQRMPNMTGTELLSKIIKDYPDAIRIILTGYSDVEAIVQAINKGKIYQYVAKPWDKDELKITIDKAIESYLLKAENRNLIEDLKEANRTLEQKVEERTAEVVKLLHNILPKETAKELQEKGYATPQHYDKVSVLFTDFKGFSKIAATLSPQEVIKELDYCFRNLDEIVEQYNLEKIKTIGDAYMCAGGIPVANNTNPCDAILAGLAIQEFMQQWKEDKIAKGEKPWELRLGIHTGELITGVVGKKKFAYDVWGKTVNLASRIESAGEIGKVNISGTTYDLVKNDFDCVYRGKIAIKNMEDVDMYFVEKKK